MPLAGHLCVSPDGRRAVICYHFSFAVSRGELTRAATSQVTAAVALSPSIPVVGLAASTLRLSDLHLKATPISGGSQIELWDLERMKPVRVEFQDHYLGTARFSPDGRWVAVSRLGGSLELWEAATGAVVGKAVELRGAVFSADGGRMLGWALYGHDGVSRVRLIQVPGQQELGSWSYGQAWGAFTPSADGTTVASGDQAGIVRLWRAGTDRELARWQAHEARISAMTFHPDGRTLVTGAADGSVKLWDLPMIRQELRAVGLDWGEPEPRP